MLTKYTVPVTDVVRNPEQAALPRASLSCRTTVPFTC